MKLRALAGILLYDIPRFLRSLAAGRWLEMKNRNERVTMDGRGIRCDWELTSELHLARAVPAAGTALMRSALRKWPIVLREAPLLIAESPAVAFVIGHRGLARLPHLLMTLRSIAGQIETAVECIVVEQSLKPEIEHELPAWVRYIHTAIPAADYDYNRAWTLNEGVRTARAPVVILHDNDTLVPASYASECAERIAEGWDFLELKRFIFYLDEEETKRMFESGALVQTVHGAVIQNLLGASIAARRDAYAAVGGFDEGFVGWGGEDNEFWERCEVGGKAYRFGYLPFVHLYHAPQKGKMQGKAAAAVRRYHALREVPPADRIERLRDARYP